MILVFLDHNNMHLTGQLEERDCAAQGIARFKTGILVPSTTSPNMLIGVVLSLSPLAELNTIRSASAELLANPLAASAFAS